MSRVSIRTMVNSIVLSVCIGAGASGAQIWHVTNEAELLHAGLNFGDGDVISIDNDILVTHEVFFDGTRFTSLELRGNGNTIYYNIEFDPFGECDGFAAVLYKGPHVKVTGLSVIPLHEPGKLYGCGAAMWVEGDSAYLEECLFWGEDGSPTEDEAHRGATGLFVSCTYAMLVSVECIGGKGADAGRPIGNDFTDAGRGGHGIFVEEPSDRIRLFSCTAVGGAGGAAYWSNALGGPDVFAGDGGDSVSSSVVGVIENALCGCSNTLMPGPGGPAFDEGTGHAHAGADGSDPGSVVQIAGYLYGVSGPVEIALGTQYMAGPTVLFASLIPGGYAITPWGPMFLDATTRLVTISSGDVLVKAPVTPDIAGIPIIAQAIDVGDGRATNPVTVVGL